MRVSRGATLILSSSHQGVETHSCLLMGATVGACRAGSRVDFPFTDCCVAPSRSSLVPGKRYLSRSMPVYLVVLDYQWFSRLSIAKSHGPHLGVVECNIGGVVVALPKHSYLTGSEHIVADTIKILPIDVEVQIATTGDDGNSVGLIQALFDKCRRVA